MMTKFVIKERWLTSGILTYLRKFVARPRLQNALKFEYGGLKHRDYNRVLFIISMVSKRNIKISCLKCNFLFY